MQRCYEAQGQSEGEKGALYLAARLIGFVLHFKLLVKDHWNPPPRPPPLPSPRDDCPVPVREELVELPVCELLWLLRVESALVEAAAFRLLLDV